jgi:hypothetical protein
LAIALSVLRFTSSDYSFGIFKPLFSCTMRWIFFLRTCIFIFIISKFLMCANLFFLF